MYIWIPYKKDISKSGKTVPLRMFDYIQRSMKDKHDELDRVEKKKQAIQWVSMSNSDPD